MNMQTIVIVGGLILGAIVLAVAWLFWMIIWATFWQRRLERRWTAELLGMLMGFLFPVTVPAGLAVLAVYWIRNKVRGVEKAVEAPREPWQPTPTLRASSLTRRRAEPHAGNPVPRAADSREYRTDRR